MLKVSGSGKMYASMPETIMLGFGKARLVPHRQSHPTSHISCSQVWNVLGPSSRRLTCDERMMELHVYLSSDQGYTRRHLSYIDVLALCANYKGTKLPHTMTLWGKVIYRRFREETSIREEQFGFMKGKANRVNRGVVD